MKILCPVCGYAGLDSPIRNYDICPCCLCEFGVSDSEWSHDELREDWIAHGAQWAWGSKDIPKPLVWSAIRQLQKAGYVLSDEDLIKITLANYETEVGPILTFP